MYDPTRVPEPESVRGRGATTNPANRFEGVHVEPEVGPLGGERDSAARTPTVFVSDASRSIISRNQSPDFAIDASVNPYRGCEHGCSYCYARPTHEYLGYSAGLDFETRILVKEDAPALLRKALASRAWRPEPIMMSGVTDPYQPIERTKRITRRCLEVLAEARNPVALITKNHVVTRDLDLLVELASHNAAAVLLSITTLDPSLQRSMEPRASTPQRRLDAVRALSDAGVPVGVLVAPVIPGLTESEIPRILEEVAEAGAAFANYVLLRLPHGVKDVFSAWLEERFPDRARRVLGRIRDMRGGALYDSRYGVRGRGEGPMAEQIRTLFHVARRRVGLDADPPELSTAAFRRPSGASDSHQGDLFD